MRRISVRAIIEHKGKLLLAKLKIHDGKEFADFWCTLGGGLEEGEALVDGLRRELIEETGIEPQIGRLLYIQQFQNDEYDHLEFFFEVTNPQDYLNIHLDATSHGTKEIHQVAFLDPTSERILPEFLKEHFLHKPKNTVVNSYLTRSL